MKKFVVLLMAGIVVFASAGLSGCKQKTPTERLKNALEDAGDAARDLVKDASKKIEKSSEKIDGNLYRMSLLTWEKLSTMLLTA
jgi:hypothetical protein